MKPTEPTIFNLDNKINSLPEEVRNLFRRLFEVNVVTGFLKPPVTMYPMIEAHFGSLDKVTEQKVVKVTNLVTFEGALFNPLRAMRPVEERNKLQVRAQIINGAKYDLLSNPLRDTPEDIFGRIEGKYSVTASNIAKYDGFHAMVVFKDHNPLDFSKEEIVDYLDTGWRWALKAHKYDPEAKYYFFLWNALRRAGASLLHGHAQVTLSRGSHYAKIEGLRRAALRYQADYSSDYFNDLYQAHLAVDCALEKKGVKVLAYLTPIKEREVMLLGKSLDLSYKERIYEVLACLRDDIGVTSFNLGLVTPPLEPEAGWDDFPVITRIVDRGHPMMTSCDFGTMELYAASVISSDPMEVAQYLRKSMLGGQ